MTSYSDMTAAGLRVLDLLTVSEAAARIGRSPKKVRRLVAAGVLEQVRFGVLVRVTPESVAAYEQRQDAARNAKTAPRCHRGERGARRMNEAAT
jgi:excisionase family DNA binding protein